MQYKGTNITFVSEEENKSWLILLQSLNNYQLGILKEFEILKYCCILDWLITQWKA